ncbi:AraC family transcriptional regulator [Kineococcus radiotolerans]|uniref:AraC family transcriptional regulator n=1 Tax=Kineococcus radiotolerans TaxID=131568 RepID=UPI00059BE49A|nr:helix-turn-helix domain-containing protein [Kineococcus radiotolerans]
MSGTDRGILYPARLPRFTRVPAPPEVGELVRWFWVPQWDVAAGRTSRQHLVAFPACNLVVESGDGGFVGFAGPTTRRSHRDLTGTGWAVGAQLRPAAVPVFTDGPAALRDRYVRLELPGLLGAVLAAAAAGPADALPQRTAAAFAGWLAAHVGEPSAEARTANAMAEVIDTDPAVVRLEDVALRLAVSTRTLQRLAHRYVGLPPAAMIRRRRLQEAAERVRTDPSADLARIAAELGYADHGHLTRDFRAVLGMVPSEYRRGGGAG